jgi:hypothetical protein
MGFETSGFFAVDDVGSISNPRPGGVVGLQMKNVNGRSAGQIYAYNQSGIWTSNPNSINPNNIYMVDANNGSNAYDGLTWERPFLTMAKAFTTVASGDTILFAGKIKEQLVCPVQVFDVSVVGIGNRPRHADSTPAGGELANSTWAAPASPVAAQALVRVLQQGWRFENILFAASAGCACIELVRNAGADDAERDASHAVIRNNRFAGVASTDSAIKFGATSYTEIVNNALIEGNDFQGLAHGIKEQSAGLQYRCQVRGNTFLSNTNDIVVGGYFLHVLGNVMSLAPTSCIKIDGGTGSNQVHGNYLCGTYADGTLYNAGANDNWNGNYASTGVTAAVPA